MIGMLAQFAISRSFSWLEIRNIAASTKRERTFAVSSTLSAPVICISSAFITMVWPPSCFIATSKLMRVRVERLSNTMANERPDKICGGENFCFFSVCALVRIAFRVSLGISERSMKCLTSFFIGLPLILNYKDSKARRKIIAAGGHDRGTVYRIGCRYYAAR